MSTSSYSSKSDSYLSDTTNSNIEHHTSDSVQDGELESLIRVLADKFANRDPQIKSVKYPALLMTSLIELQNLVGMDRLKDSIALQVMRLIDCATNGERTGKMLNCILYGPPGVGKTKVGIILAKIWYALGYLKKPQAKPVFPSVTTTTTTTAISGSESGLGTIIPIILLILFYGFTYIFAGFSYVYSNWGLMWVASLLFLILIFLLFFYYKGSSYITSIITKMEEPDQKKVTQIEDRDLIKVVSRKDFVAEYMGQSAIKTRALLQANFGKVLLIDEAYSLYNGDRDQYGMEALTEINLVMSENPDSIAIIFAGYKDLMKYGIFSVQPGLPRRCMWHFECSPYDGHQLTDIFFRQVEKDNCVINEQDVSLIRRLISDNYKMFKSYGGDTERLLLYSQIEASRSNVLSSKSSEIWLSNDSNQSSEKSSDSSNQSSRSSSSSSDSRRTRRKPKIKQVLTYSHVQHGMRRLNENKIDD